MKTDYDAPRAGTAQREMLSLEDLTTRRDQAQPAAADVDETEEAFEPLGGEMIDEELTVDVMPIRVDEFRCGSCFLIHHRSQLARTSAAGGICRECA